MWDPESLKPVSVERMRELDRTAIEDFRIPGLVLMENAGRSIAQLAAEMLGSARRVLVAAGAGNNAGDGFVIARHLFNWGCEVSVSLAVDPEKFRGDCLVNYRIIEAMEVPVSPWSPDEFARRASSAELIVDALLGTGARGALRAPFERIIEAINEAAAPALAVDVPSGLDLSTGRPNPIAVRAEVTASCGAPKDALLDEKAREYVGRLVPVYISLPRGIEPR